MLDKPARLLALAVAAVLPGCGADAGPPCLAPSSLAPSLELGTGATTFEPLVEGGTIRAYQGPQGGFHVLLWVRATGVYPGLPDEPPRACDDPDGSTAPCIDYRIVDLTAGNMLTFSVFNPLFLSLACTADETAYQTQAARLVVLDIDALAEVDGHLFEVRATLTDVNGVAVEDRVTVTCTQ